MIFQSCLKFHSPNGSWTYLFRNITRGIYANITTNHGIIYTNFLRYGASLARASCARGAPLKYTKYTYARKAYEGNTFWVGQNKDATTDEKKMHRKA